MNPESAKPDDGKLAIPGAEVLSGEFTAVLPGNGAGMGLWSKALISSISAIGVTPAMGSLENSPMRKARAPANFPSR